MLLSLQSTGPDYNHIQTNIQIPWNCDYIKYYVESVNIHPLWLTTDEDKIVYEYDDEDGNPATKTIQFHYSRTPLDDASLITLLERGDDRENPMIVDINFTHDGRIKVKPLVDNFRITTMTHRAGLVTGLYNFKLNEVLPNFAYVEEEEEDDPDDVPIGEVPVCDYYNKLYLISKQGQSIKSNIGDREYSPSILASIDHVIRGSTPIIANFEFLGKPIKNIVNIDSFKQIEMELVDFQYQPVPLRKPMFVTIKVKPCENPKMRL